LRDKKTGTTITTFLKIIKGLKLTLTFPGKFSMVNQKQNQQQWDDYINVEWCSDIAWRIVKVN